MLRDSDKINKNKKFEKIFKKMLSMVMAMCFIFAFSLTANATGISLIADEFIDLFEQPYFPENLVKYDIKTGTKTISSYEDVPLNLRCC